MNFARAVTYPVAVGLLLMIGFFAAAGYASGAHAADAAVDLKRQMTPEEFKAAGLDKLTADELASLQAWLRGEQASPAAPATSTATTATATPGPRKPDAAETVPRAAEKAADPQAEFGREQLRQKPKADDELPNAITARIKGEFRGWDGSTVFRLDNGQVWQQRVGGKYRSPRRIDPLVTIEKGRFGYYLSVEGSRRSVGVRRLR